MSLSVFSRQVAESDFSEVDAAVGIAWYLDREQPNSAASARALAEALHSGGRAMPNVTRLERRLSSDLRVTRAQGGQFRINARKRHELASLYEPLTGPQRPKNSGSVLPLETFVNSRKYVQNVVHQINAAYDAALFDCCAVMCRRLFETLIIEAFENQGALNELKRADGELEQLSGLIRALENTSTFSIGRQTKQAAKKLKDVGDWSAHNRRHVAVAKDIDDVRSHLRVACGDLLHLAGQD